MPAGRTRWKLHPETPITVPLRHAWATPVDLPYNGPMEEFARKRTRNDYTLTRLGQMGIHHVRVPITDFSRNSTKAAIANRIRSSIICVPINSASPHWSWPAAA